MTSSSTSTSEQNVSLMKSSIEYDNNETKKASPFDIPVVALCCSCSNANGSFRKRQSSDKFSLVLDLIASSERAAQEDRQHQRDMMMQMMNQNQQMMMAILATLGNKNNNKNDEKIMNNNITYC